MKYEALAPLYDRIMTHVGYSQWLGLITQILRENLPSNSDPRIFEIGGGTGVLGDLCKKSGLTYCGSDLSFSMCRQARKKDLCFICADAKKLPIKTSKQFDLFLFLYDGINYLLEIEEYRLLFAEVHRYLAKDGMFLFDVTTKYNSETNFNEYVDADDLGDAFYFRHSYFDDARNLQHNDFTIFSLSNEKDLLFKKSHERHIQRVLDIKAIKESIPENLFEVIGIWDNFTQKKYSFRSERVHFLLKKRDPL